MSRIDWSETKQARVEAAQRPRRIIFNDDTHELAFEDANTPEGFLAHRIAPLVETLFLGRCCVDSSMPRLTTARCSRSTVTLKVRRSSIGTG